MIGGLLRPTGGRVTFDGADIWTLSEAERAAFRCRHLGFVFQFPSLLSNLSAVDNVAVPALLGRTMAPQKAHHRAVELLAQVGLANRADAFPGALSGGEQRRVAIARALINTPRAAAGRRADKRSRRGYRGRNHRLDRGIAAQLGLRGHTRHTRTGSGRQGTAQSMRCVMRCSESLFRRTLPMRRRDRKAGSRHYRQSRRHRHMPRRATVRCGSGPTSGAY